MIDETLLKSEERAIYSLRALYRRYGYLPYKMSKFEEYDLYLRHKDFLVSDRVITFTDTDGSLMALKPDVTLSIIKNGEDQPGCKQKLCYNENVYRISGRTRQFKELMQTGLECIGDLDGYDLFEVLRLAAESLAMIDSDFVLCLSHLGLLSALLDPVTQQGELRRELTRCVAHKNLHELEQICSQVDADPAAVQRLQSFAGLYGETDSVLARLEPLCREPEARAAFDELMLLRSLLRTTPYADRIRFDFSIVGDMDYYNGLVFKGFLNGIWESVLSGGRYDKLMRRMGRSACGIGFALYLDLLEGLSRQKRDRDVDLLLLYDESTDPAELARTVEQAVQGGQSVSAQKAIPDSLRYAALLDLRGEGSHA